MRNNPMNPSDATFEPSTFEGAILRLETILKQLEGDKVDLATALSQYEEGVRLLKCCHGILETAQQKIEVLRGTTAVGTPVAVPLDS